MNDREYLTKLHRELFLLIDELWQERLSVGLSVRLYRHLNEILATLKFLSENVDNDYVNIDQNIKGDKTT